MLSGQVASQSLQTNVHLPMLTMHPANIKDGYTQVMTQAHHWEVLQLRKPAASVRVSYVSN